MLDSSQRLSEAIKKELTTKEVEMLDGWEIHSGLGQVAKFQATAQIYSTRVLANASEELRKSNEAIATSNNNYTFAMTLLTAGLFFVGLVQMLIQALQIFGKSSYVFYIFAISIVLLFALSMRAIGRVFMKKDNEAQNRKK